MIIYLDVLLFVNFIIDLLLIKLCLKLCGKMIGILRLIISSLVCCLFSLYIFIPKTNIILESIIRILPALLVALICNSFNFNKSFFRIFIFFYTVSFIYAGAMMGIWMLIKPERMTINNGVVYFNISPLLLITLSLLFYVIIVVLQKFSKRNSQTAERLEAVLYFKDKRVNAVAMVDTGHTLTDLLSDSVVIIIDLSLAYALFGKCDTDSMLTFNTPSDGNLSTKFRLMTVKTVSGEKLMPAVKLDLLKITDKRSNSVINNVLAVISDSKLGDDFSVIVPTELI